MKIVQINTFPYKATGTIMMSIHENLLERGYDSYVVWGRGKKSECNREIVIKDGIGIIFHGVYARMMDKAGFASWAATKKLLKKLEDIKPDIIHLHNIHGYYVNVQMLFSFIEEHNIRVVWTLHDCWPYTGHCATYDHIGCDKWKNGCGNCKALNTYPKAFKDNSIYNWKKKKNIFNYSNLTIVTPSAWLKTQIRESMLKENKILTINNGIDLNIFQKSKETDKKIYKILGVANEWREEKGLYDFIELSEKLPKNYQIILIGTTAKIDKILPESIISIHRTRNRKELCEYYSSASVFVNMTKADNFPTVNIEALACGTPVVTYDTGGSPEIIDCTCGCTIKKNDVDEMCKTIINICSKDMYTSQDCIKRAKYFSKEKMIQKYIDLYEEIMAQ